MKTIVKYILFIIAVCLLFSCEDYLEKTPYAEVTDADVFQTYESFQGFIDKFYGEVIEASTFGIATNTDFGGDLYSINPRCSWGNNGDYWSIINQNKHQLYMITNPGATQATWVGYSGGIKDGDITAGYWYSSWRGIRNCNLALEKLSLLTDATQEEKTLIKGQIYFFRAFFHFTLIKNWGGMPYIDKVFSPNDPMKEDRLTYQACTDRLVLDLDTAALFLPEDWDETVVGQQRPGANTTRVTKGAAFAYKAKALLYAGSPMMNGFSGGSFAYNTEYMKKAAAAAWEVIKLADKGVYGLVPFENYRDMFARKDATYPWTSENIFGKYQLRPAGSGIMKGNHGRYYNQSRFGGNAICNPVNQLYVDRFEMADGTRYKEEYDNDNIRRWEDRDPRFRQNIIVDRDKWGYHNNTLFEMYEGGKDKGAKSGAMIPYIVKKYWPIGVNSYDKDWNDFKYVLPHMRLAELYLFYAEAVNEAYGADGSVPGASLTAVGALNKVRTRAGMPDVTSAATGYGSFRELVWNERCVELCFEGHYWFDIRRWYVGHLPEYKQIVDLSFDKDWTTFTRSVIKERYFEDPKHYWMPIDREQTQLYSGFGQNPGW